MIRLSLVQTSIKKGWNLMQYKFVAIDLDDTLLADDLKISPETINAIQDAVEKGVHITLATGRMYQSAAKFAKEININIPIITYQGAYVKNIIDQKVVYQKLLPFDITIDIITKLKEKKKAVQVYLNDKLYTDKDNQYAEKYSKVSMVDYYIADDLIKLVKEKGIEPMKILVIDEPEKISKMSDEFNGIYGDKINITVSKPRFLEFSHAQATKGQAIFYLTQKLGIKLDEVIAIGDSFNDLDMIQMAGLGVAMKNAHPRVKAVADYITKTNNDHGVAEVLKKFIR